jgi:hypothetical protein
MAAGPSMRDRARLRRLYGRGRWRKRKGRATVRLPDGTVSEAEVHWYEASAIGRRELKIKHWWSEAKPPPFARTGGAGARHTRTMARRLRPKKWFVVCVRNTGYRASLEVRKIYQTLSDPEGEAHGLLRVIDESGEDYLYPEKLFLPLDLPHIVETALRRAVG